MVSVVISKLGLTDLIFVDPGVKINGGYYPNMLRLPDPLAYSPQYPQMKFSGIVTDDSVRNLSSE